MKYHTQPSVIVNTLTKTMHQTVLSILMIALSSLALPVAAKDYLPASVASELQKQKSPSKTLAVYAREVGSNKSVIDWNGKRAGNPASSIKAITTFAALDMLGPDYRWPTEIYHTGTIKNQTLNGDLIIKGYGDPSFVNESMQELVAVLRQKFKTINGRLIVDSSYFQLPKNYPSSLDGAVRSPYNAIPNAMNMNFGTNYITVTPNKNSSNASITIDPPIITRALVSDTKQNKNKCRWYGVNVNNSDSRALVVKSTPSIYCRARSEYSVIVEPHEIVGGGFKKTWLEQKGELSPNFNVSSATKAANATFLWRHFSKPLIEQIADMNKKSNNVMTRQLFLTLAAKQKGAPATLENAREVMKVWMILNGINHNGVFIDNGAGLSRTTRISPQQVVEVLEKAVEHKEGDAFIHSLAIAGVDGTMRKRFTNHPAKGKVFVKTGTLKNTRTMAAVVYAKSGKVFAVSTIHEDSGIENQKGTQVQNKVLEWLYLQ